MGNNELYHHGVLGMKWGVRRYQNYDGTPISNTKRSIVSTQKNKKLEEYIKQHGINPHADIDEATKRLPKISERSSKKVEEMSDSELRTKLNRIKMEQEYNKLNPSTIEKGKQASQKVLKTATTIATVSSTAITIYNNWNTIQKILKKG